MFNVDRAFDAEAFAQPETLSAMNFIVSGHGLETTYKPAINQMAPQGMFAETDIGRIFR